VGEFGRNVWSHKHLVIHSPLNPISDTKGTIAHFRLLPTSNLDVSRAAHCPRSFTSKEDLVETLLTSCHIPWWACPLLASGMCSLHLLALQTSARESPVPAFFVDASSGGKGRPAMPKHRQHTHTCTRTHAHTPCAGTLKAARCGTTVGSATSLMAASATSSRGCPRPSPPLACAASRVNRQARLLQQTAAAASKGGSRVLASLASRQARLLQRARETCCG